MCHHAPIPIHERLDWSEIEDGDASRGEENADGVNADGEATADVGENADGDATPIGVGERDPDGDLETDGTPSFASDERSVDVELLDRDGD